MSASVLHLARPDILELEPYRHADWDPRVERMHANEMPWRVPGDSSGAGLNRYPEPQPRALVARMAELYGVSPQRVLVGRGSDEAIDLLLRVFCRAGQDSVVVTPPTFGFYQVAARIQGAAVIEVPLAHDTFALLAEQVIAAGKRAKIVFLCSPNNPTGNLLDETALMQVCEALEGEALVVVDEAYVEFSGRASFTARLDGFANLVILRTLSKSYGLAGARLGSLVAREEVVALLRRIIPPYAIPSSTTEQVLALTDEPHRAAAAARIRAVLEERAVLRAGLERCANVARVSPSDANFLLVRCEDAQRFMDASKAAGLIVRDVSSARGLSHCVRVSVGTPEQNRRLLSAVADR